MKTPKKIWAQADKTERGGVHGWGHWQATLSVQDSVDRLHYSVPEEYIHLKEAMMEVVDLQQPSEGWEPDSPQAAYERGWNAAIDAASKALLKVAI